MLKTPVFNYRKKNLFKVKNRLKLYLRKLYEERPIIMDETTDQKRKIIKLTKSRDREQWRDRDQR